MRLTTTIFLSLDGVYQAPGAPDEDARGGFRRGGWQYPYVDDDFGGLVDAWFDRADAFLLGRRTYEIFAAFWPKVTDPDNPVATKLNSLPKYVASRAEWQPEWAGTTRLAGDLAESVAELKRHPGRELQIHGSGVLVRALHDLGLIDEYRMLISPVVLGDGMRLFEHGSTPSAMRLVSNQSTSAGCVCVVYEPAGAPTYGSLADG